MISNIVQISSLLQPHDIISASKSFGLLIVCGNHFFLSSINFLLSQANGGFQSSNFGFLIP